jgi:Ca2+-binding RTX toxin-like protein
MPVSRTFTAADDVFSVNSDDSFYLDFLAGNDRLTTWRGSTVALMGDGDDLVLLRGGAVQVDGGNGNDRFNLYAALTDAELDGGSGSDRFDFLADSLRVTIQGGLGNDNFYGNAHAISGSIYGGDGNDGFYNFGRVGDRLVSLYGGLGNDVYRILPEGAPRIFELADEGIDTVQVATGASYTLGASVENLTVVNFATGTGSPMLRGNDLANTITGGSVAETMYGMDGNDMLRGNGGDDLLWGVNGDDRLYGGDGNDELHGQAGNDVIDGGVGDDAMIGGTGDDVYWVNSFGDIVVEADDGGTDTVRVDLSSFLLPDHVENAIALVSTTLYGNALDNELWASGVASGGDGDDIIHGSYGSTIYGNAGNDTLIGNGSDVYGGSGADVFAYNSTGGANDIIRDFEAGIDRVDLSAIDANPYVDGDQAFTVVSSFTGHPGEVIVDHADPETVDSSGDDYGNVWVDVNGDAQIDLVILLKWAYDFSSSDLVL